MEKTQMLPRIILHNAMSVDGRMDLDWATTDIGLYYELAAHWNADAILSGSRTILDAPGQEPVDESIPYELMRDPADSRPLFVIVDSQGQIHNWNYIRQQPYWRDAIVLCSQATPRTYLDELKNKHVEYLCAGEERVDLRAALEQLAARYGIKTVRVDSGGVLNGVLLRAGLVDEVSVLINPTLIGGLSPRSIFVASDLTLPDDTLKVKLIDIEKMRGDAVWLRYEILKRDLESLGGEAR
jgi:2,5-diamino-6-(ribosylamino)-4(3H)-pyrimidinone 5'-phosphate reductase